MIKYLPLFLLIACNSSMEKKETAHPINVEIVDSMTVAFDSLKDDLKSFYQVSDYAKDAQAKLKKLESERDEVHTQRNDPVYMDALQYMPSDKKDEELRKMTEKLLSYEREILRLRRIIYRDSVDKLSKVNYDIVPEEKPNDKSLIITLNKKIRGDGEISETGVSVW